MPAISEWYQRNQPNPLAKMFIKTISVSSGWNGTTQIQPASGRIVMVERIVAVIPNGFAYTSGSFLFRSNPTDGIPGIYEQDGTTEYVVNGLDALYGLFDQSQPSAILTSKDLLTCNLRPPMKLTNSSFLEVVATTFTFTGGAFSLSLRGWELAASDY